MERGLTMLMHSTIIGVLIYVIMVFLLGYKSEVAEDRSLLIASLILAYMILFGHGLPKSINKNIL